MNLGALIAALTLLRSCVAFLPSSIGDARSYHYDRPPTSMAAATSKATTEQIVADYKAQAAAIRLEVEKMDAELTLNKIETLERRLKDKKWLAKNKGQEEQLVKQLDNLKNKIQWGLTQPPAALSVSAKERVTEANESEFMPTTTTNVRVELPRTMDVSWLDANDAERLRKNPLEGFAPDDLDLFLPVALAIEAEIPNATLEEQLAKFRDVPALQERFQQKIQELILNPMEEMQELENLRQQYLSSTSSVEKDTLKRQIDRLELKLEEPFSVCNSFYRDIKPMHLDELDARVQNLNKLPKLLQSLYMRRNGIDDDMDLELGILMEHYDEQLQLLDQLRYVTQLPTKDRESAIRGFESLPTKVKAYFVKSAGLKASASSEDVINGLMEGTVGAMSPLRMVESSFIDFDDRPEYNDIEFIERSQYIEELLPSITAMEDVLPSQEDIDYFVNEVLDPKIYGLRSKPERVFGGYYVRGFVTIQGDDANDKLVSKLCEKLAASKLSGKVQFFFVPDPKALTDEEIDMGEENEPILIVTGVDSAILYRRSNILTKLGISAVGLLSLLIFSVGACELNGMALPIEDALKAENVEEVMRLTSNAVPIGLSLIGIQLAHEGAHRLVALRDRVGPPSIIPSFQLGITGTITPLESPPKNLKSLFDFALAGPLMGILASLSLLVFGLEQTVSMGFADQALLPGLPAALVKSSALGGGLVAYFLGNGALNSPNPEFAVLPLHPLAVAGFVGLSVNALALLPLGHTDGGRITLAMFGRRGAYLIKTFAAIALCLVGLLGLDNYHILILYAVFAYSCQRELETPMRNEVDQVDDGRAMIGFATGLLVTLTLLPMP